MNFYGRASGGAPMHPRTGMKGLPRGPHPMAAASGAGFSLPPAVATTCASITMLGGAVVTVGGIGYPLFETYMTVKRLEASEKEMKKELKELNTELKELGAVLQKIALKLNIK